MNTLLKIQLKKVYGKDFNPNTQDKKFKKFLELVKDAYEDYEAEERLLEKILEVNAKELEKVNTLLVEQRELLKSVENSMDDAIYYKDLEHKYIGCNKKFEEFIGLKEKELIGKTDDDFFDEETALRHFKFNEEIIHNRTKQLHKQWVNFGNKKSYVLTSKTPLINSHGDVIGIVGISKDITHEYELQQDVEHKNIMLVQQNKLVSMGEMIANIAHQWRQPLNTLGLLIQKMGIYYKQGLLDMQTIDDNIFEAMELMNGMSETIDDFRNFFCNERVLEHFDIYEAILKSVTIIKPVLDSKNIKFVIQTQGEHVITGYKNEFFQVMLNLLNNATEALVIDKIEVPKITVNIAHKDSHIDICICDNANGISYTNIDKIFDPYFTTKENGTGLGLYMSKIIIEEHMKGKIMVKNSVFGTIFTIRLTKTIK